MDTLLVRPKGPSGIQQCVCIAMEFKCNAGQPSKGISLGYYDRIAVNTIVLTMTG